MDGKWYFFRHVPKSLLLDLEIFEKILLSSDIQKEIFEKAIELVYTKEQGKKIKDEIEAGIEYFVERVGIPQEPFGRTVVEVMASLVSHNPITTARYLFSKRFFADCSKVVSIF